MTGSVGGWVDILRTWSGRHGSTVGLNILQQTKPSLDDLIARVQICCASVGVDCVGHLVIATFVKWAQVEPNFRNVWVDPDRPGIGIESVMVPVDVVMSTPKEHQKVGFLPSR